MSALIECNDLSKHYGRTRALDGINLNLEAGSPIALIGPNGAGKTTLLSLLCGYIRPTRGSVKVFNHKAGSSQALTALSALPQDANMDPAFSIELQLQHYAKLRGVRNARGEAQRVLELVQLADRGKSKAIELSHGMRKRVMIAQALIGTPKLVLLDEPTAGIDPPNVKIIRELIAAEATNATFIVSSHNLDELEKVCSTVVHLADGQLQGTGSIDDANNEGVISVQLSSVSTELLEQVRTLDGVREVHQRGSTEFVVEYDQQNFPEVDIDMLKLLSAKQIRYRRISKGRSLEDQIFSETRAT